MVKQHIYLRGPKVLAKIPLSKLETKTEFGQELLNCTVSQEYKEFQVDDHFVIKSNTVLAKYNAINFWSSISSPNGDCIYQRKLKEYYMDTQIMINSFQAGNLDLAKRCFQQFNFVSQKMMKFCVEAEQVESCQWLLEQGLEPELNMAFKKDCLALVKLFLCHGATLDRHMAYVIVKERNHYVDVFQDNVFMEHAIQQNKIKLIKKLVSFGIPIKADYIVQCTNLKLLDYLLKHGERLSNDQMIDMIVEHDDGVVLCNKFMEYGLDLDRLYRSGQHLLHRAIAREKLDVMDWCLAHGVSINVQNMDGLTCLHQAVGDQHMTKYLVIMGAFLEVQDNAGQTVLMKAIRMKSAKVVKYLVRKGANVNHIDQNGWSIMHHLWKSRNSLTFDDDGITDKTIQRMFAQGAKIDHVDDMGQTVMDHINQSRYACRIQPIFDKLYKKGRIDRRNICSQVSYMCIAKRIPLRARMTLAGFLYNKQL